MTLGRLVLVTASTDEPVSRKDVKAWLKIEEEELTDDALLDSLIEMARARYEERMRRSLMRKTYDEVYDDAPRWNTLMLSRAPLVSVSSIKGYTDTDATDTGGTSMSSSEYYVDTASEPGRIVAFGGFTYPTATRAANAFIVRYVAGYSTSTTGVPEQAKTTLKQMVARAYEFRGDQPVKELESVMDGVLDDELALPEWG